MTRCTSNSAGTWRDQFQESQELLVAVPGPAGENLAGRGVQRGEQRRRAGACNRGSSWRRDPASSAATVGTAPGPGTGTSRPRTTPPRTAAGPGTTRPSTSLASNRGSLDNLNVSTRHGRNPRALHRRATVSLPTPWRAAMARVDQCVAPSAGRPPNVSATIASTTPAGISGLRPRPGRTRPTAGHRPRRTEPATPAPCGLHPHRTSDRPVRHPVRGHHQRRRLTHLPKRQRIRPRHHLQLLTLLNRHLQRGRNHHRHTPTLTHPTI